MIVLFTSLLYSFIPKKTAIEVIKESSLQSTKVFQQQLDSLQKIILGKNNKTSLLYQFKKTRLSFKKIEFLLEYIYPRIYPFFNGANAIEMDDGYDPTIQPEGLQVLEDELFKDSLDIKRILFLITQLKYRTLSYYQFLQNADLKDIYFFDAIRYHLIRIETLNLVSFDSPTLRNNVEEITVGL